jgi:tryptophan synthase alpha chain
MNRLDEIFATTQARRIVIPYVCAGDPDAATTHCVVRALALAGAQIVEIGIPFTDPLGDGRTIGDATQRALHSGMTLARTLELCASLREGPAIVLMGYLNPIAAYGIERFAADARRAGVCGAIVADLPYEERLLLAEPLRANGVALIALVAPTTPLARAAQIAAASDAFVYVVSRLGVTGAAREPGIEALATRLQALRSCTTRPLAVGFGVSNATQIRRVAPYCDAAIVGSALIDALAGRSGNDAAAAARAFYEPLLAAAEVRVDKPESSTLMRSTSVR